MRRIINEVLLALSLLAAPAAVLTTAAPAAFAQDEAGEGLGSDLVDDAEAASTEASAASSESSAASSDTASASSAEAAGDSSSGTVPGSSWFRLDTDGLGTQFWVGATHQVGGLKLASDIYVTGSFAELDVGLALSFGNLSLTPMVGVGFDFAARDLTTLIAPQLFTIYTMGDLYFESWIQVFINSPFVDGVADLFYTRNFLLYKVNDWFQVGPELDISINMGESAEGAGDSGLVSLPIGPIVGLDYGTNTKLLLFVGYETQAPEDTGVIAGRFTFLRTW